MKWLLLICCWAGTAAAGPWTQIATESRFQFQASFEGVAMPGEFKAFTTELNFDPAMPEAASLTVTVDLRQADMGDADINSEIHGADWFDVGSHPTARFYGNGAEDLGAGQYRIKGRLQVKGIDRPLTLPFNWKEDDAQARLSGEVMVWRSDFDVGSGEWADGEAVSLDIQLSFDVVLERKPASADGEISRAPVD